MSTIKVDTIATRTGSGNITLSNTIAGNSATFSGDLTVDTSTLKVDATNNRVLIGTTTEGSVGANQLTVADSGNTGITIRAGTSSASSIYMSDATSGAGEYSGYIAYSHASDSMAIAAAGGQRIRIDADGLKFGSDTAAANALDDYEEGNFTPTFGGSGGNQTVSYSVQLGTYIKVGKMVQITVSVIATGTPSGGSGDLIINGIPFTSKAGIQQAGSVAFTNNLGTASGTTQMTCNIEGGVSYLNVNSHEYSGPSSMSRTEAPAIQNSAPRIVCSICYEAA